MPRGTRTARLCGLALSARNGGLRPLLHEKVGERLKFSTMYISLGARVVMKFCARTRGLFNTHPQYAPVYACSVVVRLEDTRTAVVCSERGDLMCYYLP